MGRKESNQTNQQNILFACKKKLLTTEQTFSAGQINCYKTFSIIVSPDDRLRPAS